MERIKDDFTSLRDPNIGTTRINDKFQKLESLDRDFIKRWYNLGDELIATDYDNLDINDKVQLPESDLRKILLVRLFFLELYNHPYRIDFLNAITNAGFIPPPKVESNVFISSKSDGIALSIGDLDASILGADNQRVSRTDRYAQGPFVCLGRQARTFFVGSENPDIFGSAAALATMAASHSLASIPRNGILHENEKQVELAKNSFRWLSMIEQEILEGRDDRKHISSLWRKNIIGAVEPTPYKALARAEELYNVGVRGFRVYSPEPGVDTVNTAAVLRRELGDEVEIFTGQIVDEKQAILAQENGVDGIYVGIGGGGRCITGVRSGSVVDWPELVWNLRGKITIPIIVQGGASDHTSTTLLLGASGIGVSRKVAGGTIESPGGANYFADENGILFKIYGGEASARMKFLDGKLLPFEIPSFVEGETNKAIYSYIKHSYATLTHNLHTLIEDSILGLVFRGVTNLAQLHSINPSPLRKITQYGDFQRNTH